MKTDRMFKLLVLSPAPSLQFSVSFENMEVCLELYIVCPSKSPMKSDTLGCSSTFPKHNYFFRRLRLPIDRRLRLLQSDDKFLFSVWHCLQCETSSKLLYSKSLLSFINFFFDVLKYLEGTLKSKKNSS